MANPYQGAPNPTEQGGQPSSTPPSAPRGTQTWFAVHILQALGAPTTRQNIAFLIGWMHAEGHGGANNPLNTTDDPQHKSTGAINGVGVKNFATPEDGVAALAFALRSTGHYGKINASLQTGNPSNAFSYLDEFATFSGNTGNPSGAQHYVNNILSGYRNALGDPLAGTTAGVSGSAGDPGVASSGTRGIPASLLAQYGFLLDDPQVGPLLRAVAADPNYDLNTFDAQLAGTDWWKQHASTARQWMTLQSTDPATWAHQKGEYLTQVVQAATRLGAKLSLHQFDQFADSMGRFGWTPTDLDQAILNLESPKSGGEVAAGQENVRSIAAAYGVNLTDDSAFNYEKQLQLGQATSDTLKGNFALQAKALYPHLAAQIDQGLTLRDVAQPYITQAANLLEVNPDTISLSDPRYTVPLGVHDGKTVRQMTQYEWATKLMSDPAYGWNHTQNARDSAVGLADDLGQWTHQEVV